MTAMRRPSTAMMMALLAGLLGACSGGWWPFGRSEGGAARIPAGATEYSCAEGKRLLEFAAPAASRRDVVVAPTNGNGSG